MKVKTIILVLAVAAASIWVTYSIMNKNATISKPVSAEAEKAPEKPKIEGLKISPAVAGEGWDAIAVTGKVTVPPDRLVKISPRIEGKVVAAKGTVGDIVRQGQVLATISSVELAEARAQYKQAIAKLKAAQADCNREVEIMKMGASSARPAEEARVESLTAQGELADAKSELAQAKSEQVRAESELVQCKARYDRAKDLYADQIVSKADLETAQAEFKRDSASVDEAVSKVSQAQARIDKAQAKVDLAKQYEQRESKVYKGRVMDMRSVQSAKSALTAAKIDVQSAADKIRVLGADPNASGDGIAVISPISGRIVSRSTNVGEIACPENPMFTVANLGEVWIEADVYEKDLPRVKLGQRVEIRADSYPDKVFAGSVEAIGEMLSSDSRTAKVRCSVANPEGLLRGEMFAQVRLLIARNGQTVLLPREAVLDDAGQKIVYTPCMECPEDQKAGTNACGAYDKLVVTTGATHGSEIEITSGVTPGTLIVTTGAYQLKSAIGSGKLEAGCTDH